MQPPRHWPVPATAGRRLTLAGGRGRAESLSPAHLSSVRSCTCNRSFTRLQTSLPLTRVWPRADLDKNMGLALRNVVTSLLMPTTRLTAKHTTDAMNHLESFRSCITVAAADCLHLLQFTHHAPNGAVRHVLVTDLCTCSAASCVMSCVSSSTRP